MIRSKVSRTQNAGTNKQFNFNNFFLSLLFVIYEELTKKARQKLLEKPTAENEPSRKQTIFERYGYTLGKDLGSGSYAKVKVNKR